MMKIGKMADYALVITIRMAKQPTLLKNMEQLASATQLPLATVRKLMRLLLNAGLVRSVRGVKGGYQLARLPEMISVAQVVQAVEGPMAITECCDDLGDCELSGDCEVESHMPTLNALLEQVLAVVTLSDLGRMSAGVHHNVETFVSRLALNYTPQAGAQG